MACPRAQLTRSSMLKTPTSSVLSSSGKRMRQCYVFRDRYLHTRKRGTLSRRNTGTFTDLQSETTTLSTKTFVPTTPAVQNKSKELDDARFEHKSFLQQKAHSVISRRAQAASASSMTSAERAAFEGIWKSFEPKPSFSNRTQPAHHDQKDTNYIRILQLFANPLSAGTGDGDHPQDRDLAKADKPQSVSSREQDGILTTTALKLMGHISTSLHNALTSKTLRPDVGMWEVCEREIFPLSRLVVPQKTSISSSATGPKHQDQQLVTSTSATTTVAVAVHPLIPSTVPIIPLLSQVYPAALLLALRMYHVHHPESLFCIALLPHVKSLGPTSYVLGVNTYFYNTLLTITWDTYSDLNEISRLLTEMGQMGLEYDASTARLLRRINDERTQDLRGEEYYQNINLNNNSDQKDIAMARQRLSSSYNFDLKENRDKDKSRNERTGRGSVDLNMERGVEWWQRPLVKHSWNHVCEWQDIVMRQLEEKNLGEVMGNGAGDSDHLEEDYDGHNVLDDAYDHIILQPKPVY